MRRAGRSSNVLHFRAFARREYERANFRGGVGGCHFSDQPRFLRSGDIIDGPQWRGRRTAHRSPVLERGAFTVVATPVGTSKRLLFRSRGRKPELSVRELIVQVQPLSVAPAPKETHAGNNRCDHIDQNRCIVDVEV